MKKVIYLFPTNRQKLVEEVKSGISPDNNLYGFNYLQKLFQAKQADIPARLERILNTLLLPVVWIFNSRYTKLNFGRVILALPQLWQADKVVTCVDSINKAAAVLKKFKLFSASLICMAGNVMDGTEKFPRLHQWLWSGANKIIIHAPVDQEKLVRLGLGNRGVIILVGSDETFWQKVRLPRRPDKIWTPRNDGRDLVVSVGADRDRDYKTLFLVAEQLPLLKFVVCCGRQNVAGLKIPKNVEVRINVPPKETRLILSKAGMVVLPLLETYRASGQLSMLDAMLMGKPVIASKTRGIIEPYGLKDEENVLLVPAGDPESLIKVINKLQNSENLTRELGSVGRNLVLGYTTENYAEKLKKVIFTSS